MKQVWKGSTLLAPVPAVLVSVGDSTSSNFFTVAWTGIICSEPPRTYISVRKERFSYDFIKASGEFVINLVPQKRTRACDYAGVTSGKSVDKWQALNLTKAPASEVKVPLIAECPIALECKVFEVKELGSHDMFLADIVAVDVDESLLSENGKLRLDKAQLMSYVHGEYFTAGESLGNFGFSVRKREATASEKKKESRLKKIEEGK